MDNQIMISIATDFSTTPGSRYRNEGPFSGEEFREDILEKKFTEANEGGKKLVVNLDGGAGYATSFLEEVFGGLARAHSSEAVLKVIEIISTEEAYLKDDVIKYIKDAQVEN